MYLRLIFIISFFRLFVECSKNGSSNKITPHIIGGDIVTDRSKFPYQVSLRNKGNHFCGGSILDQNHIITAAHCSFDGDDLWNTKHLTVVAGDLDLKHPTNFTIYSSVQKIYAHPLYNASVIMHDIAVWRVSKRFSPWNANVKPIDLANYLSIPNSKCSVSGWGTTNFAVHQIENVLRYVNIPLIEGSHCSELYRYPREANVICAGIAGKDSCQGDSGGPLVCDNVLLGIVSYGADCGKYFGVYTDVTKYDSWIRKKTASSSLINSTNIVLVLMLMLSVAVL